MAADDPSVTSDERAASSPRREHTPGTPPAAPDARRWLLVSDLLGVLGSFIVVLALARPWGFDIPTDAATSWSYYLMLGTYGTLLISQLAFSGQYEIGRRLVRSDDLISVLRSTLFAAAFTVFICTITNGFFTGFTDHDATLIVAAFGLPVLLLLGGRLVAFQQQRRVLRAGAYLELALVIGDGERSSEFTDWAAERPELGINAAQSGITEDLPAHQFAEELTDELLWMRPDEVIIAFNEPNAELQRIAVVRASSRGIPVKVLPGVTDAYHADPFTYGGYPVAPLFLSPRARTGMKLKRALDLVGALVGLIVLSPLFLIIAIMIKLEDRGPVFYMQTRLGLHGRRFEFLKFRSMRLDGDEVLEQHLADNADARAEWDEFQKLKDDPRITRVGHYLRKGSIDELPQLVNVLFGEMSLVGPRPPMPEQADEYGEHFVFSQVRPGITGLWQVSGRNEIDFRGRISLDVWYIEHWSVWLDLKILIQTVRVVLTGKGAY